MIGIEDKLMNVEGHLREISLLRRLLWGRQPSFLFKVDMRSRILRLHSSKTFGYYSIPHVYIVRASCESAIHSQL